MKEGYTKKQLDDKFQAILDTLSEINEKRDEQHKENKGSLEEIKTAENASVAARLVKETADATATALNIQYIQKDITEIKMDIKALTDRDGSYVLKEEFAFWRNILVGGLLLSIAAGVLMNVFQK